MQGDRIPEAARLPVLSQAGLATPAAPWAKVEASLTLEAYARLWIEQYRGRTSRGIDESTRHDYRRSLELHVLPVLGGQGLDELRPADLRGLVLRLEAAGQAPSSIRKHLAPLRALLATAVEDGLIAASPAATLRIAGRREGLGSAEPRTLTGEQVSALFAELPPDQRPLFELLLQTGVRISEAVGLRWADVVLDGTPYVCVRRQVCRGRVKPPKSRYGRRDIPLSSRMAGTLAGLRAAEKSHEGPVFASGSGGCLDVANLRRRVLRPAAERAGIGRVGFHVFRHTCASLLFAGGKDLKQVQHWLGHHDPAFTLSTYVHLLDGGLGGAELFDELPSGS